MEILLEILGVVFLLILAVVGYFLFKIRRFFKALGDEFRTGAGMYGPPSRISLERDTQLDWVGERKVKLLKEQLLKRGFEECGAFTINEMPGTNVLGFANETKKIYAAVYRQGEARVSLDLVCEGENATSVTATNGMNEGVIDTRPGKLIVGKLDMPIDELFSKLRSKSGQMELIPTPANEFAARFEASYDLDMKWRNSLGGAPTWEEFVKTSKDESTQIACGSTEFSNEQLRDAHHETVFNMGVMRLNDECVSEFRKENNKSVDGPSEELEIYFALHDYIPESHFMDFVENQFELGGVELLRFKESFDVSLSVKENFHRFNDQLPVAARATKVGEVHRPVPAEIFALRENWEA